MPRRNCLFFIAAATADTQALNGCRMEAGIRGGCLALSLNDYCLVLSKRCVLMEAG